MPEGRETRCVCGRGGLRSGVRGRGSGGGVRETGCAGVVGACATRCAGGGGATGCAGSAQKISHTMPRAPVAAHARASCPTPQTILLERIVSLGRQVNVLQDSTHQKHCWLDACEWKLESLPIHLAPVAPKQAQLSSGSNAIALGVFKLPGQRGPAFLYQDSMKVVEEPLDMGLVELRLVSVKSGGRLKIWVNTSF